MRTTRRDGLGSTIAFRALAAGDIDVYVDYSGTIWGNEMQRTDMPGRAGRAGADRRLDAEDTTAFDSVGALGFENAYAFAMRARPSADALHINTPGRSRGPCAAA